MNIVSKKKSLTVVIPIHNSLKFKRNILKIINENHRYCELILIDDGNNQKLFKEINNECSNKNLSKLKKTRARFFSFGGGCTRVSTRVWHRGHAPWSSLFKTLSWSTGAVRELPRPACEISDLLRWVTFLYNHPNG